MKLVIALVIVLVSPFALAQQNPKWSCTVSGRFVICTPQPPPNPPPAPSQQACPIDTTIEKYQTISGPPVGNPPLHDTSDSGVVGNTNQKLAAISGAVQAGIGQCTLPDGTLYTSSGKSSN